MIGYVLDRDAALHVDAATIAEEHTKQTILSHEIHCGRQR
jgi:hypothetical protein